MGSCVPWAVAMCLVYLLCGQVKRFSSYRQSSGWRQLAGDSPRRPSLMWGLGGPCLPWRRLRGAGQILVALGLNRASWDRGTEQGWRRQQLGLPQRRLYP